MMENSQSLSMKKIGMLSSAEEVVGESVGIKTISEYKMCERLQHQSWFPYKCRSNDLEDRSSHLFSYNDVHSESRGNKDE